MRTVDLNGVWLFKEISAEGNCIQDAGAKRHADVGWAKAHVPGVVHLDLVHSKKIPHPYYGLNELDVKWVEDKNWHGRKIFTVDEKLPSR